MPETSSGRKWLAASVILCLLLFAIWMLWPSSGSTTPSGGSGFAAADDAAKKKSGDGGSSGYGNRYARAGHGQNANTAGAGRANDDDAARKAQVDRRERLRAGDKGQQLAAGPDPNGNGNGAGNGNGNGNGGGNGAGGNGNGGRNGNRGNPFFNGGFAGFNPTRGGSGFGTGGGAGMPNSPGNGPGTPPPGNPNPGDSVYVVTFKDSVTDPKREAEDMARLGFRLGYVYIYALKGFSATIPDHVLPAVQSDPRVQAVEISKEYKATQFGSQVIPTGIRRVNAHNNRLLIGNGNSLAHVVIAVIDTGCDVDHPDLNVGLHVNFVFGTSVNDDDNGHGTHVAGTAAAIDNTFGVIGVAPGAQVWGIKVLDAGGAGTLVDILAGIDFVGLHSRRVHVANLSLGGPFSQAMNDAVHALWDKGIVVCVAAGNDTEEVSDNLFTGHSPASARRVLTIAAMGDSDGAPGGIGMPTGDGPDDTFATFSNFGEFCDFVAPGVEILSTHPLDIPPEYEIMDGTSMACPHVAGMAGLLLRSPDKVRNIRFPNPQGPDIPNAVRDRIMRSVTEYILGINGEGRLYPLVRVDHNM